MLRPILAASLSIAVSGGAMAQTTKATLENPPQQTGLHFYPFIHGRFTREPGPWRPWTADGNVERCYHFPYDCPAVPR